MFIPANDIQHLTGLRAVAALMVMLLHLSQFHGNHFEDIIPLIGQGWIGVDIFFVLSGYILAHVYKAAFEKILFKPYFVFLWRRFARLYPIHLATLGGLFFMVAVRGLLDTNWWILSELPSQLLMLHAWSEISWNVPAWSISAEWLAYMAFPLVVFIILRPSTVWVPLITVITLLFLLQIFAIADVGLVRSFNGWPAAVRIACEFVIGVFGYRMLHTVNPNRGFDVAALVCFAAVFLTPYDVIKVVLIAFMVPCIAASNGPVKLALSTPVAVYLGEISYAIYMCHWPIARVALNVNKWLGLENDPGPLLAALMILVWSAVIIAISAIVFRLVEMPARRWLRNWELKF